MAKVTITLTDNGPYMVEGPVSVMGADRTAYLSEATTIFLCRCGRSRNTPFCHGTQETLNLQATYRSAHTPAPLVTAS